MDTKTNDPIEQTVYTLISFALLLKKAINGITPIHIVAIISILFFSTSTFETSAYQFTANFFRLLVLATITGIALIGTSIIRPPKWTKPELKKWDSMYFSDLMVFTIVQLILATQGILTALAHNSPILLFILLSVFFSIVALLIFKLYVWFLRERSSK